MNFDQLRYFVAIAKTGGFSNAAYDLFISQSSISKQIKALEDELCVELFKREHSKVTLTEAGMLFEKYAKKALADRKELLLNIEQFRTNIHNTIRMGSIPILSAYNIGANVALFINEFNSPSLTFDMNETSQSDIMKKLLNDSIDLALIRLEDSLNLQEYDIIPFAIDVFYVVCNKNNPLSKKSHLSLEEIAPYPLVILGPSSAIYNAIISAFKAINITPIIQCSTTRHRILMEMLSADNIVTILPERLVDTQLYSHVSLVPLDQRITSKLALVKLKNKKINKSTRDFWKFWKDNYTLRE